MATIRYLWNNRVKFSERELLFYKVWAKRLFSFPEVIKRDFRRRKLISSGAVIHPTAEIGEGRFLGKKEKLEIGANTFIGKAELALHAKITIGSNVCINDGVRILTASHDLADPGWKIVKKAIHLNDNAWIAVNAIILPGVTVGRGAVVGAGAVVTRDVDDFTIVAGNPAKPISKQRESQLNYNPCEFLAANRAWLVG